MNIGYGVNQARKEAGLTIEKLAAAVGVTKGYISQLENAKKTNPTPDLIERIADACRVPVVNIYVYAIQQADFPGLKSQEITRMIRITTHTFSRHYAKSKTTIS